MKKTFLLLIIATLLLLACGKKEAPVEDVKPAEETPVVVEKVVSMNFAVQGKGEVAKELIEKAALTVAGVTDANWDMDKMSIKINGSSEVVWEEVHGAIAGAGFDTTEMKATDEAYMALPDEAKYRIRKATVRSKVNEKEGNRTKAKRQKVGE